MSKNAAFALENRLVLHTQDIMSCFNN